MYGIFDQQGAHWVLKRGYNCCFFLNFVPLHIESPYNFGGKKPSAEGKWACWPNCWKPTNFKLKLHEQLTKSYLPYTIICFQNHSWYFTFISFGFSLKRHLKINQIVHISWYGNGKKSLKKLRRKKGGMRGHCHFLSITGVDPAGGAPAARPPPSKIGKNMICWRKIVIFHTKYPKKIRASLRLAQFF